NRWPWPLERRSTAELERLPEARLVALLELPAREPVILRAPRLYLDGSQERGDSARGLPIQAVHEPVNEAGAIGIAAARGIDDGGDLGRGNVDLTLAGVDHRALGAARHDE